MIFSIRTTGGQERTVAEVLTSRAVVKKLPIYAVLVSEAIKGYIFVESSGPHVVDEAMSGVKHARAKTRGSVPVSAIERFIVTKPAIEDLNESDMVEIIAGPFRGLKAKITEMDKVKEEVTIELLEEGFSSLPITVHADYVRRIASSRGGETDRKETD